ncbi:hypothetical protein A2392_00490 [Candidatus Kaiserbacteria bacterium RIFOXYB1_FULL_46_14]|uniref:FAD-binding FR-type domain-containing protein n=1 Tax=Candidatus Kaiserbacteria bacterium RIFOXYB1_FULL_46_14 TaxID=1798531 RepID=A0A1F6FJ44_9BACT|nr:MAG: hypothetical protein A2392_00490 [Candidatus Kaiserbacteria bacterium RIFOXYB1_FULL_46_14]
MLDVLLRALRHPISYSKIYRVTNLTFKEKIHEVGDIYSFIFTSEYLPNWRAGQHAIFTIPDKPVEGKAWRAFSVASAPHENEIRIGTIVSSEPSSFKQQLSSLQTGEKIRMYGPYGELCLNEKMQKVIGVAGGIGITPFRSIVKDLSEKSSTLKLQLIYSARDNQHTYRNDMEKCRERNQNISIIYTASPEEVNAALENAVAENHNDAHYLLSGPPKMIESLRLKLLGLGISRKRILNDPFKGY